MKTLWRVSNHCDLDGLGGEKADGRWHTAARGKRIVYLSDSPAGALLESLANLKGNPELFPEKYQLLEISVPDDVYASMVIAKKVSVAQSQIGWGYMLIPQEPPLDARPVRGQNEWLS